MEWRRPNENRFSFLPSEVAVKFKSIPKQEVADKICELLGEQYRALVNTTIIFYEDDEPSMEMKMVIRDFVNCGAPSVNILHWKETFEAHCFRNPEQCGLKFCIRVLAQLYDNEHYLAQSAGKLLG